jgi:probable HAF family extracellular repeat protein
MTELRSKRRATCAVQVAAALMAAVLTWGSSNQALAQEPHRLTILGPLDEYLSFSLADINNAGQVLGTINAAEGPRVALWDGASLTDLGTGGASALNNSGQAVGTTQDATGLRHATLWDRTGPTTLSSGNTESLAFDINDRGQVVGIVVTGPGLFDATRWQDGNATTLGPGYPSSINNLGQAVGAATGGAALWDGNGVTLLGEINSEARGINDLGQIVGYQGDHAHLWDRMRSIDLDTLGGTSVANAINNRGQSVGAFNDGIVGPRAALWNGTVGTDLNSLLRPESVAAGWLLDWADGINDNGWIIGLAHNVNDCANGDCQRFGFLLSVSDLPDQVLNITGAVPEPSTYALMLAGLGALGLWVQRRRAASASR